MPAHRPSQLPLLLTMLLLAASCKREERGFRVQPPSADSINATNVSGGLHAGSGDPSAMISSTQPTTAPATQSTQPSTQATQPSTQSSTQAAATRAATTQASITREAIARIAGQSRETGQRSPIHNEYEENAHALTEGKTLYSAFNCVGCHAHGGGDKGPPLMDNKWIYGSNPEQIFATIVEGRPNGMPSFRDRIPDYQVWQIAAYVRSMSGLVPKDAAPGRDDHMKSSPPENSADPAPPKNISMTHP